MISGRAVAVAGQPWPPRATRTDRTFIGLLPNPLAARISP
jgi:hypothetical protein